VTAAVATRTRSPVAEPQPSGSPLLLRRCACGGTPGLDGECAACHSKRLAAPSSLVRDTLRGHGRPLEPAVREEMEARFSHDFSRVRVHTDGLAADSARAVNASAYTVGRDVVFGAGRYAPATSEGSRLLAHELAHTIQQRGATTAGMPIAPESALEAAAASAGRTAASGRTVSQPLGRSGLALARDEESERRAAVAEAEAVAARIEKQLAEADVDEPDPKPATQRKTPSRFSPGGFTDEEADKLAREAESRIKLGSMALTLAERQARRREFWDRNPGYNSADLKEAFDLDLYWDPKEEGFIRQPYVDKQEAVVNADPEARDLYGSRLWDLTTNKPEKKSRFTRAVHFVCEHTEPCSTNIEQFRKDRETMSRDAALNRGMARLVVSAETMLLPTPGPSGPIKLGPGGTPTGMPFEVQPTEGPSLGGPEPATVPAAPATKTPPVSKPILTTGGRSGKPPPGKVEPSAKVEAPTPEPASEVAAPAPSQRPGTVTVEASRQAGLVKPGGKLDGVLQSIEAEFASTRPTTLNEAVRVVDRATVKVGLARGIKSQPSPDYVLLKNVGGIETRVYRSGEIVVTNQAGQVLLHMRP
jgi:hypothetical protein